MNITKILFFADGAEGEQAALNRTVHMASLLTASIEVVDVVPEISADSPVLKGRVDKLQERVALERQGQLDSLIAHLSAQEARKPLLSRRVLAGKEHVEVIRLVQKENFDLLVKPANSSRDLKSVLFGGTDRRLLHHCPCPVLILKPEHGDRRSVLAAVDPVPEDSVHMELNNEIMGAAARLSRFQDAPLHILHAWELKLDERLVNHTDKDELAELMTSLRTDTQRRLKRLMEGSQITDAEDHLVQGCAERVITDFVAANDIDLLVMGTVAKSGAPGFLVGNTAEKILDAVDCSVLALKPEGWVSPID